jgi:flagellar motor switch protein FliM
MRSVFLSQAEIDALLNAGDNARAEIDASEDDEEDAGLGNPYSLSNQERIVRGRMPTMEIVNERFARNLRIGLYNLIRRAPDISVQPVQVQKYSLFLREVSVPTNFNIVAVKPLRGNGMIVCDPSLIFSIIDTLFGGNAKYQTRIEGREFTGTEQRIIRRVVHVITEEYIKAWKGIYPLSMEYQRSEMQPQFANIAAPSEMVVSTTFGLEIGDVTGYLRICIPYSTLEPIRDVLYSTTQGDAVEVDQRWVNMLVKEIQSADVTLVAELANAELTVQQLMVLRPGDFIELERPHYVQASVKGVPVLECQFGTHNGKYALRVERSLSSTDQPRFGASHVR